MAQMITVNGRSFQVLNSYSCGPGELAHTYDIYGGYVYEVAGTWLLVRPGQWPVKVTVSR